VVIGGDWNRNPPLLDLKKMTNTEAKRTIDPPLDKDFLPPGWICVYDPTLPSNRDVDQSYVKGKTKTTIIDFFYISPNLKVIENKTIPTGWEFSDHQPVYLRVKMKPAIPLYTAIPKADNSKSEKKKPIKH
jgi:exonuclease III